MTTGPQRIDQAVDGITLWRWPLDPDDGTVESLAGLLNDDERRRAEAFTRDVPRRRFIVARGRLREVLAERLGCTTSQIAFAYGPNGKPRITGVADVEFNLAHTADLALCAIGGRAIGIDVEFVRPMESAARLARRWFHEVEVARIDAAQDPLREFFGTWTKKEAALKLVGVGVGESLPRVITPAGADGVARGLPTNELRLSDCRVRALDLGPEYAAALATVD